VLNLQSKPVHHHLEKMDPQHMAAFRQVRTSEYLTVEENYQKLKKFIDDYKAVKSSLTSLSEKCRHPIMVPIGNVAFMSGSLVHTNDVLVLLGDNWFVEQSAKQTIDILNRRIEALQTEAKKLESRMQQIKTELSYVQGLADESSDTVEIAEPYDEQFEQSWKAQHDANVRKYRQEIKESITANVDDGSSSERMEYEQILRRLDQLEKEEAADDDVEEDKDEGYAAAESGVQETVSDSDDDSDNTCERSRAFVINFKHSETGSQIRERCATVLSPADIYDRYCSSTTSHIVAANQDRLGKTQVSQSCDISSEISDSQSHIESRVPASDDSEILQSSGPSDMPSSAAEPTVRKVSKFKASRLKK